MKLVFVRNNLELGSWLIRWGSHEKFGKADEISHCGILFKNGLFFHSTLSSGVHFSLYETYIRTPGLDIVGTLEPRMELSENEEQGFATKLTETYNNKNYDIGAFFYLAWAFFKKKILGKPLPKFNELDEKESLLCFELIEGIKTGFREVLGIDFLSEFDESELMWPQKLFEILLKEPNLKGGYHD